MPDFSKNYPPIRNVSNATNKLTETEISENVDKAEKDALSIMRDFGDAIVDSITQSVDDVINGITNNITKVVQTATNIITSTTSKLSDIIKFVEDGTDDISQYISDTIDGFNKDDVETEISIDSYIDIELDNNKIVSENGVVQQNISGTIANATKNMSNVDKRDITQYTDSKLQKIQDIKKQCSDNLVDYAKKTSQTKFNKNNDIDEYESNINLNNLNYKIINIKSIKVTIANNE